ncbi:unnamed protein product [Danaus chrysippus]|uniref:(African queen) hypothetical protein n=1 Tax=Danaus chrysippus TaxID=151541 RepID=A0A8J2R2B5_9NEOP|nr:unnamed protein product [Danaus chrysippus]
MFGIEPRVRLMTSPLPRDVIEDIRDEDDLENALNKINMTDSTDTAETEPVASCSGEHQIITGAKQAAESSSKTSEESPVEVEASQYDIEAGASTAEEPLIIPPNDKDIEVITNVNQQIMTSREAAHQNLKKQDRRMTLASDKIHVPVEIGDNVIIQIPDVDRAKANLRNIVGVILQKDDQGFHKIGTKYGMLDKLYCRYEPTSDFSGVLISVPESPTTFLNPTGLMPISDVLSAFHANKHDPVKICDIFEETPIEERQLLNSLVKQQFGCHMPQLYYNVTKCIASLNFDFEFLIPRKFDVEQITLEDRQIIDYQIHGSYFINIATGLSHDIDQHVDIIMITTPQNGMQNRECETVTLMEDPVMEIVETNPPDGTDVAKIVEMGQNASLNCEQRVALALALCTSPIDDPGPPEELPHKLNSTRNDESVVTSPSTVRKQRISRFTLPRAERSAAGEFRLQYYKRKTDDIVIYEVEHQGMIAHITTNITCALELAKTHVGSHTIKLGIYNFICPNNTAELARNYAYWLYCQITDGHLNLSIRV